MVAMVTVGVSDVVVGAGHVQVRWHGARTGVNTARVLPADPRPQYYKYPQVLDRYTFFGPPFPGVSIFPTYRDSDIGTLLFGLRAVKN